MFFERVTQMCASSSALLPTNLLKLTCDVGKWHLFVQKKTCYIQRSSVKRRLSSPKMIQRNLPYPIIMLTSHCALTNQFSNTFISWIEPFAKSQEKEVPSVWKVNSGEVCPCRHTHTHTNTRGHTYITTHYTHTVTGDRVRTKYGMITQA